MEEDLQDHELDLNRRLAVVAPMRKTLAIRRHEAPPSLSSLTCSGVMLTRGRPTEFLVCV